LIIVAGVWAYHNSFHGPFVFDDVHLIVENPHVRQLARPWQIITHSSRPVVALSLAVNYALGRFDPWGYHVVNLIIHVLAGLTLFGIVRRTLLRTARSGPDQDVGVKDRRRTELQERFGSAAVWLAGAISLIWLVHPLQTESVTYIIQRAESLMGLFYLLTVYCFIRGGEGLLKDEGGGMKEEGAEGKPQIHTDEHGGTGVGSQRSTINGRGDEGKAEISPPFEKLRVNSEHEEHEGRQEGGERETFGQSNGAVEPSPRRSGFVRAGGRPAPNRQGRMWFALSVAACALGMASKPVMVTAPVVILLYDRVFLASSWREVMRRRGWVYAGLAATWLLLPWQLANGRTEWETSAGFGYKETSPLRYALTQPGAVLQYLRLTFWPNRLCLDYGWPWRGPDVQETSEVLWGQIVVAALLAATVWACKRRPALGFLGVWFFLILAPTSSFVPVADAVVEHRMYLPLAAVVTLVVVGVFEIGRRLLSRRGVTVLGCVGTACVVALFTSLTLQRNRDYRSAVIMWQDVTEKRPNNSRAHNNLGFVMRQAGRVQEAIAQCEQALQIDPDYTDAHNNLGIALMGQGRLQEAVEQWELALRIEPNYPDAHYNLGVAMEKAGRAQEAITQYEQALQINPDYADAHNNLGTALVGQLLRGEGSELNHRDTESTEREGGRETYGQSNGAVGRPAPNAQGGGAGRVMAEAIRHYEEAVRIRPDYPEAHYNLGFAFVQLGRMQEGIEQYQLAVRFKPDYAEAEDNLGVALAQTGRVPEAINHFQQALRINPDFAEAHNNLGGALMEQGRLAEAIKEFEQAVRIKPDYADARNNLARARGGK
jgi:protein O-mannosyl-transferase